MPVADQERFLPCLLDRLTDDEPDKRSEPPQARAATVRQVRQAVLRDLRRLLNCHHRLDDEQRRIWPQAASSVIDWGVPDVCGRCLTDQDLPWLAEQLRRAVLAFEPRFDPPSVRVRVGRTPGSEGRATFAVEIGATLHVASIREEVMFRSLLDTESGHFTAEE
ncbi:MAG: type VI secretion system baseplate subunit TssE [Planctomycetes bacterium]|nr:type VI secretion system baseplate subunit TssE [Planctomycetota bacterium]